MPSTKPWAYLYVRSHPGGGRHNFRAGCEACMRVATSCFADDEGLVVLDVRKLTGGRPEGVDAVPCLVELRSGRATVGKHALERLCDLAMAARQGSRRSEGDVRRPRPAAPSPPPPEEEEEDEEEETRGLGDVYASPPAPPHVDDDDDDDVDKKLTAKDMEELARKRKY